MSAAEPGIAAAISRPPDRLAFAAFCLVGSATCFSGMGAMIRHVAEAYALHPFVIAFFRGALVLALFIPWMGRGLPFLPRRQRTPYAMRGAFEVVAVLAWFYGVTVMPLADFTAVTFTSVLVSVAIAAVFLGEKVGPRRWAAVAAGFVGVVLVLRPGAGEIGAGTLAAVVTMLSVAGSRIAAKLLARTETANAIVFYNVLYVTPLTFLPALAFWSWPSGAAMLWLFAIALVASLGHLCLAQAYRAADISVLAPFDFFQLPAAAFFGFVAFGQLPDALSWAGAAIIVGSALYATYRETRLRRAASAAAAIPPRGSSP